MSDAVSPEIEAHVVAEEDRPIRLGAFGAKAFERIPSRSWARKATKRGDLRVQGEFVTEDRFLEIGERVSLHLDQRPPPKPYPRELTVLWHDEHAAVVVKPPGLPTSGNRWRTLQNALPSNLPSSTELDALPFPRPVHRLDVRTGGLIVVARTASAMMHLGRSFERREVFKRYLAMVGGRLDGEGVSDTAIDGRSARTEWTALEHTRCLTTDWMTTVECHPVTGRTHQIRRHLAELGHPIVGDDLYGGSRVLRGKGLFLWSVHVRLAHPVAGTIDVELPEPHKYKSFRIREARRWERWQENHP